MSSCGDPTGIAPCVPRLWLRRGRQTAAKPNKDKDRNSEENSFCFRLVPCLFVTSRILQQSIVLRTRTPFVLCGSPVTFTPRALCFWLHPTSKHLEDVIETTLLLTVERWRCWIAVMYHTQEQAAEYSSSPARWAMSRSLGSLQPDLHRSTGAFPIDPVAHGVYRFLILDPSISRMRGQELIIRHIRWLVPTGRAVGEGDES